MRPRDLLALEFPRVLARLADFAASAAGKERCLARQPVTDRAAAESALERAWQCFRLCERHGDPPLGAFDDVRPHLRRAAHAGFVLDGPTLVAVRATLEVIRTAGAFFRRHAGEAPALAEVAAHLVPFAEIEAALHRALDDDGGVRDQASDELAGVRATIRRLRDSVTRRLEELVARPGMADVVSDTYVTLRNNRFVIPVRAGAAPQLPGVVQDRSISGETLFVEPLFAVELNNQLLMAVREEEAIVRRILADLTALAGAAHEPIARSIDALIDADCLAAGARFARAYHCTRPRFSGGAVTLRAARHPGLLFTGRPVTPVDLVLPADRRALVITGPNTGGKTVALKTLGLCALMAQSGLLIPAAEGAELPCFAAVFADVGDEQSIERNLSTFSAHVANLCEILAAEAREPLVLLDEPGVGTDPEEGAALAIGLIRQLVSNGARLAVTTHYTPVKLFALSDPNCAVAAVDFDVDTLTPRYRLVYDSIGRSLALPIAQRLGLPEAVLAEAAAAQSESSRALSEALARVESTRRQLEEQLALAAARAEGLGRREADAERLLVEARERRRRAWSDELREARAFVRTIKDEGRAQLEGLRGVAEQRAALERFAREQEAAIAAREAPEAVAAEPVLQPGPLRAGDTVAVGDRGIQGRLLSVDGPRAWIQRGSMRFEVPALQLRRVPARVAAPANPGFAVQPAEPDAADARELSLIGLRARDAVERLERFLDHAVRTGQEQVRIIHGLGSGALQRAVHDYLAHSPYCAGFRAGEAGEGGAGVTVAVLNG